MPLVARRGWGTKVATFSALHTSLHCSQETSLVFISFRRWVKPRTIVNEFHSTLHTRQSSIQNNKYQMSQKHSCFSWWWAHSCPKHVEKRNKHTKKCFTSWLYLQDHSQMLSFDRFHEMQSDSRRVPNRYLPWFQSFVLQYYVVWLHDYQLKLVTEDEGLANQ
jgi:hypothetical protein